MSICFLNFRHLQFLSLQTSSTLLQILYKRISPYPFKSIEGVLLFSNYRDLSHLADHYFQPFSFFKKNSLYWFYHILRFPLPSGFPIQHCVQQRHGCYNDGTQDVQMARHQRSHRLLYRCSLQTQTTDTRIHLGECK